MKALLIVLISLLGCTAHASQSADAGDSTNSATLAMATFAGGCFWCMEPPFDQLEGVISTTSGYMGGQLDNPSYSQVSAGGTGHAEVIKVIYDPGKVSYQTLLSTFWHNIDPTDAKGQFCDKGNQYRSGVFYHTPEQQRLAEQSKTQLLSDKPFQGPVLTPIQAASAFYPAEDYHQNYYQTNPLRYKYYRYSCGRDARLEALWGSADK